MVSGDSVESASSNDERADAERREEAARRLIETKFEALKNKKRRMDEIMGQLATFTKGAPQPEQPEQQPIEQQEQLSTAADDSEQEFEERFAAAQSRLA